MTQTDATDGAGQAPVDDQPTECDLVMKGGITSGVVYPSAVLRLKERYRLRNIGGASAGAIAAVVTAAAAYGDQVAGQGHGYETLERVTEELGEDGFMLGLFQPSPAMRPAYDVLLAALMASTPTMGDPPTSGDPGSDAPGTTPAKVGAVRKAWIILRAALPAQTAKGIVGAVVAVGAWLLLGVLSWAIDLIPAPSRWSGIDLTVVAVTTIFVAFIGAVVGMVVGLVATVRRVYQEFEAERIRTVPRCSPVGL